MKVNVIELDETQTAEVEAAEGSPDVLEAVLARIINEAECTAERAPMLQQLRDVADKLRLSLLTDTLLCTHYLLHERRTEEALLLLCPAAALIEGAKVPQDVFNKMMKLMDCINTEREKDSCGGSA